MASQYINRMLILDYNYDGVFDVCGFAVTSCNALPLCLYIKTTPIKGLSGL